MILVMDTATPVAFIGLWDDGWKAKLSWEAGRNLSAEILTKLELVYKEAKSDYSKTSKIIVNAGPGSYTGLRIGLSTANTLAYTQNIPIIGIVEPKDYDDLIKKGLAKLKELNEFSGSAIPHYGSEPNITQPKKTF